jgi:23S rRNA (uracil1939-C5)-methyltransferase
MSETSGRGEDGVRRRFVELAARDELDLDIEKIVAGGDGFGRFGGLPVFVARSAPGDRVRVRIVERRPQYARAEILEVLEAGPGRREPPCPHFSDCGGCDLQHLGDELQTELKVEAARETLLRLGGLSLPEEQSVFHSQAWGYRLRSQVHLESEPRVRVGYFARGSNRLVEISQCRILAPELERFVLALHGNLGDRVPARIDVAVGDEGKVTCAPPVSDLPRGPVEIAVGDHRYQYDARTFFQGHRGLLKTLVDVVLGHASGEEAWDLYAGVGLFTIPLAARYERVQAVESDRVAVRYLMKNARRAGNVHVEAVTESAESAVRRLPPGIDRVVVDPPRAGLGFRVRAELFDRHPREITYVSCHPAVLARDLKHLCRRYSIQRVDFLDLFPQTGHIEVVAQLRLNEAAVE